MNGARLAAPLERIKDHYDAVVVGSGYGGGVAACRLAGAGWSVCVLERGREIRPGEYPNDTLSMLEQVQIDLPLGRIGSEAALFDIRVFDELNVAMGCGLGGTSLINAGISLRPDPRIFDDPRWPAELRTPGALEAYYVRADDMLKPAVYPEQRSRPAKLDALEQSGRRLGAAFSRVPMLVNFEPLPGGLNHVGVEQGACMACGDCVSGCNYGAKNTVLMNYLPEAKRRGAEIYVGARVAHLERVGERWRVRFGVLQPDGKAFSASDHAVSADVVVLGAGALGSTEILLRSRGAGLTLSPALGQGFSGNGDMIGLVYNADRPVNGVGWGRRSPVGRAPVGSCSTGLIDARAGVAREQGFIMVDGAIPGAFGKWLPATFIALDKLTGRDTDSGFGDRMREKGRAWSSKLFGPYVGAVHHTQLCLVVAQDDAAGRLSLENGRLVLRWPDVGRQAPFARASEAIRSAADALGGTYIPNPIWHEWLGRKLISGHPLGGCRVADDARAGVVNHKGQVFGAEAGTAVHRGLYVLDAGTVPRALGVNPLLAITALAERSAEHLLRDVG
jgi:cholesterol oxidase